jgi:hypothetical protein
VTLLGGGVLESGLRTMLRMVRVLIVMNLRSQF